ncbi:hypothetical protein TL16_g06931 [Triparma laevis f. inornata]|uniref:Myb-like domain-containing protein n=1 Tax=Triparma laevis f. inornata TaxID=1714386 RepID=A0A9W7AX16_9STRA|nr:hypothetical protein TL16_g06931 [Triparma laevis f. inornata]
MSVATTFAGETSLEPSVQLMGVPETDPEADPWFLKSAISIGDDDGVVVCQTENCTSPAISIWSTQKSKDIWHTCESCQETDFGGWPEGFTRPAAPPAAPPAASPAASPAAPPKPVQVPVATAPPPQPPQPSPQPPTTTITTITTTTTTKAFPPAQDSTSSSLPQSLLTHGDAPQVVNEKKERKKNRPFSKEEVNALCYGVQTSGKSWKDILKTYAHIFEFRKNTDLSQKYARLEKKGHHLNCSKPPPANASSPPPTLHPDEVAAPSLTPDPTNANGLSSVPILERPGRLVLCPKDKDGIPKNTVMTVVSQSKNWVKCTTVQGKEATFAIATLDMHVDSAKAVATTAKATPPPLVASTTTTASASREDDDDMSAMTEESR